MPVHDGWLKELFVLRRQGLSGLYSAGRSELERFALWPNTMIRCFSPVLPGIQTPWG